MTNFKEVEFKYHAKDISRKAFDSLINKIGGIKRDLCLHATTDNNKDSVDHYFTSFNKHIPVGNQRFMRWREGQNKTGTKTWELTSKVKLSKTNNNVRDEVNIPLSATGMNFKKALEFSAQHLCGYDFSIKKDVQIYWLDKVVFSHYTTFTLEGKELHTFMEIEADESHNWASEEQALEFISEWEKKLVSLGITAKNRIKKSLFEFYSGKIKLSEGIGKSA